MEKNVVYLNLKKYILQCELCFQGTTVYVPFKKQILGFHKTE